MIDYFRPHHDPARTIYDALLKEATKRKERTCDEWIMEERRTVYETAVHYSQQNHMRVPTMAEIVAAETSACGHVDYACKFALRVAQIITTPEPETSTK